MINIPRYRPKSNQKFPQIDLKKAIQRFKELYRIAKWNAIPSSVAAQAWKYSKKSSGIAITLSALKSYGLICSEGESASCKIKLSEWAQGIILDLKAVSPERDSLIKKAALAPQLHNELYNKFGGTPPSDEVLLSELGYDRLIPEKDAQKCMKVYKDTLSFAKLDQKNEVVEETNLKSDAEESITLINESNPSDNFKKFYLPKVEKNDEINLNEEKMSHFNKKDFLKNEFAIVQDNKIKTTVDRKRLIIEASVDENEIETLIKIIYANKPFLKNERGNSSIEVDNVI